MAVDVRAVDDRGRIVLGRSFANKLVQVERISDCELRVVFVQAVPENEMWLYHNESAKSSVFRGLEQARKREFVDGPDLAAGAKLLERLEGNE
jgi:hypothetical protein